MDFYKKICVHILFHLVFVQVAILLLNLRYKDTQPIKSFWAEYVLKKEHGRYIWLEDV